MLAIIFGALAVIIYLLGTIMATDFIPWIENELGFELSQWEKIKFVAAWPCIILVSLFMKDSHGE